MVAHPSIPAKDLKESIALAKAKPDTLTYGFASVVSITQLLGEKIKFAAGIKVREIPYKAIGSELPDVLVSVAYLSPVVVNQHIRTGKLRALAVATAKRVQVLSNVPTMVESGLLQDVEATGWNGLFVPVGTPPDIIKRLQVETAKALNAPVVKNDSIKQGYDIGGESSEEFAAFIRAELAKWGKVIKESGIK